MHFARTVTRHVCRLLIGAVLFAQLSIAAYACPGLMALVDEPVVAQAIGGAGSASDADTAALPLGDMDQAMPGLCAAHCQTGQQAADQAQPTPTLAPVALVAVLYTLPALVPADASVGVASAPSGAWPVAAAPPPHAILHCCFRI